MVKTICGIALLLLPLSLHASKVNGTLSFQGTAVIAGPLGDSAIITDWIDSQITSATYDFSYLNGQSLDFIDPWVAHLDLRTAIDFLFLDGFRFAIRQQRGTAENGGMSIVGYGGVAGNGYQGAAVRLSFTFSPTVQAGVYSFVGRISAPETGHTGTLAAMSFGLIFAIWPLRKRCSRDVT